MTASVTAGESAPLAMDESTKRDAPVGATHLLTAASGGTSCYMSAAMSSGCVTLVCQCWRATITWTHRVVAVEGGETMTNEYREQAKVAIEGGWDIAYDVAALSGQMFENVKHMSWFIEEVANAIAADEQA